MSKSKKGKPRTDSPKGVRKTGKHSSPGDLAAAALLGILASETAFSAARQDSEAAASDPKISDATSNAKSDVSAESLIPGREEPVPPVGTQGDSSESSGDPGQEQLAQDSVSDLVAAEWNAEGDAGGNAGIGENGLVDSASTPFVVAEAGQLNEHASFEVAQANGVGSVPSAKRTAAESGTESDPSAASDQGIAAEAGTGGAAGAASLAATASQPALDINVLEPTGIGPAAGFLGGLGGVVAGVAAAGAVAMAGGGGSSSAAGGAASATTVDTVAPGAPTITSINDNVSPVTGTVASGTSDNDSTPTLVGRAEALSTVRVYDGKTLLGATTADATGAWSYTTAVLGDGSHSFTATATDAAGNVSAASTAYTETIDTAASALSTPAMTAASDSGAADNITSNTTPAFTGSGAEVGASVKLFDTDGTTLLGTTTALADGSWSITSSTLSEGSHTLRVAQTDIAGNTSALSSGLSVTVDTTADSKVLRVVDPPVKGATVVYDANHNGKADAGEAVGTTDEHGNVKIDYTSTANGRFIVTGGEDTVTGHKFDAGSVSMVLRDLPSQGNAVISPISTLLAQSDSLTEADLKQFLNLPASVNLATFDYYAEIENGGPNAIAAGNALKLAQLVDSISNAATQYLSADSAIDINERGTVSQAIAKALEVAASASSASIGIAGSLDTTAIAELVTKFAVATVAEVKAGNSDVTTTLRNLETSYTAGTFDTDLQDRFGNMGGADVDDLNTFIQGVSNVAVAISDNFSGFVPGESASRLSTLAVLSESIGVAAHDLGADGSLSTASNTALGYLQNSNVVDQLAQNLSADGGVQTDSSTLFNQLASGDSHATGIDTYGDAHVVAGTILDTSYHGLQTLGVDLVNPAASILFATLDQADPGQSLSASDVQSIIDAAAANSLPAFADQLDVTLRVTQAQLDGLVDVFDGHVNGQYDGAHTGADLVAYGIDHIGLDSSQGGLPELQVSAPEMQAIKDAGLDFAQNDAVTGSIGGTNLSASEISQLADWAVHDGVDQLSIDLTDTQAASLAQNALDLPAEANVHLTAEGSHLSTSLNDLANLGVDSVESHDPKNVLDIKLGVDVSDSKGINADLEALLTHFKPDGVHIADIFTPTDDVTLELGAKVDVSDVSATVLTELKLLGVDTITGADADHDGQPDHKPTS